MNVQVGFKRLVEDAKVPTYAHASDSGADLCSIEDAILSPGSTKTISTGIAVELPAGWDLQCRGRSGLAAKHGVCVLNSPGTIDNGYTGELKVILHNASSLEFKVSKGDRIAQLVLSPVYHAVFNEIGELKTTERKAFGFGSTGK